MVFTKIYIIINVIVNVINNKLNIVIEVNIMNYIKSMQHVAFSQNFLQNWMIHHQKTIVYYKFKKY